jgi:hypothetical protein
MASCTWHADGTLTCSNNTIEQFLEKRRVFPPKPIPFRPLDPNLITVYVSKKVPKTRTADGRRLVTYSPPDYAYRESMDFLQNQGTIFNIDCESEIQKDLRPIQQHIREFVAELTFTGSRVMVQRFNPLYDNPIITEHLQLISYGTSHMTFQVIKPVSNVNKVKGISLSFVLKR